MGVREQSTLEPKWRHSLWQELECFMPLTRAKERRGKAAEYRCGDFTAHTSRRHAYPSLHS